MLWIDSKLPETQRGALSVSALRAHLLQYRCVDMSGLISIMLELKGLVCP